MRGHKLSRRTAILSGVALAASAVTPSLAGGMTTPVSMTANPVIVIIGGGFGGAAAARAAKQIMPRSKVVLLTDQTSYWMCPGSNAVLTGLADLASIEVSYRDLSSIGIDVRIDPAIGVDANKHTVTTQSGAEIRYDKLIMSPGVAFKYDDIEGLSEATIDRVPHAWKAGPQTIRLQEQLYAMRDGGLFVMTMPQAPYRCPPAPAERACLVADYIKREKPKSKLLILDAKDSFPFQDLFSEAWDTLYSDIIEYRSIADDGLVREVDAETLTAITDFDEIQADVLNVIPPQTAGRIAITSGAADVTGWCPVDIKTFASTLLEDVYVIGDAALVNALPKAGSTAASQALVVIDAIAAELAGEPVPSPSWIANCYSLAAPDYGVRLGASYIFEDDHVVRDSTDFSELGATDEKREADARYAEIWLQNIKAEIWG